MVGVLTLLLQLFHFILSGTSVLGWGTGGGLPFHGRSCVSFGSNPRRATFVEQATDWAQDGVFGLAAVLGGGFLLTHNKCRQAGVS